MHGCTCPQDLSSLGKVSTKGGGLDFSRPHGPNHRSHAERSNEMTAWYSFCMLVKCIRHWLHCFQLGFPLACPVWTGRTWASRRNGLLRLRWLVEGECHRVTRESWEEEDERASLQRVNTRARALGRRAASGTLSSLLWFFLFYPIMRFRVVFSIFKSLFVRLAHRFWFWVYFLVFLVMRPLSSLRV